MRSGRTRRDARQRPGARGDARRRVARERRAAARSHETRSLGLEVFTLAWTIAEACAGVLAAFGWWWADPVAALAMPPLLVREALRAWRGEDCGC